MFYVFKFKTKILIYLITVCCILIIDELFMVEMNFALNVVD